MQVKQHFTVARPRSVVWDYFNQIDKVTLCMPGASLEEPATGNFAKFKFNVKLGPIGASFVGEAELERNDTTFCGVIRGAGRDSRGNSRARGQLEYALSVPEDENMTRIDVVADFALMGSLAQFSRLGLVNDLAARLTAEFTRNLEAALTAETAPVAAPGSAIAAAPRSVKPTRALSAGSLLLFAIWGRVKVLARRILQRRVAPLRDRGRTIKED